MKTVTPLTMCNYTAFNNISPVSPLSKTLSLIIPSFLHSTIIHHSHICSVHHAIILLIPSLPYSIILSALSSHHYHITLHTLTPFSLTQLLLHSLIHSTFSSSISHHTLNPLLSQVSHSFILFALSVPFLFQHLNITILSLHLWLHPSDPICQSLAHSLTRLHLFTLHFFTHHHSITLQTINLNPPFLQATTPSTRHTSFIFQFHHSFIDQTFTPSHHSCITPSLNTTSMLTLFTRSIYHSIFLSILCPLFNIPSLFLLQAIMHEIAFILFNMKYTEKNKGKKNTERETG